MSKINTFIFDCFGVICEPVLSAWYKENSIKYGFVDENLQNVFKQLDLGKLSEDDIVCYFSRYRGVDLTKEQIKQQIKAYFKLDEPLLAMIKKLRIKKSKVALLTNANSTYFKNTIYPNHPEFKSLFDQIIISSDVGMIKPDKAIYLHALERIGSKPQESLFVDDNKSNVDAALGLGIKGFVYTNFSAFEDFIKKSGIGLS